MIDFEPDFAASPPRTRLWGDHLRWLICVMSGEDKGLPFIAGVFAKHMRQGDLTEKQRQVALQILRRVQQEYMAGVLPCQVSREIRNPTFDLASAEAEGEA